MGATGRISDDLLIDLDQITSILGMRMPVVDVERSPQRRNLQVSLSDLIDYIAAQVQVQVAGGTVTAVSVANGLLVDGDANLSITATGTISPLYGTSGGTIAQGNDSRIVAAVDRTGDLLTGYLGFDYSDALTAAGTVQADALLIAHQYNRFSTVASGAGGRLPASLLKRPIFIRSDGANSLKIYPNSGASINGNTANAALTLFPGAITCLMARSATAWESFL